MSISEKHLFYHFNDNEGEFSPKVLFRALKPTFREEIPPKMPVVNCYCWNFLQTNVERNNSNKFGENRLNATSGA